MKPITFPRALGPLWLTLLLGVPIASTALLATQSSWQSTLDAVTSRWHPVDKPYRYRYFESAERMQNPIGRIEQEIALYQERLRQDPTSASSQSALAIAYLQMARATGEGNWYLLAEQAAQQSLASLPFSNSEALMLLARVEEARHDFAGALKLAAQDPGYKESIGIRLTSNLAIGNLDAASQAADQLVDRLPSVSALTLRALVSMAAGQDDEALENFRAAIANEEPGELSSSARVRTLLGRFYYERGNLTQAKALYREALRIQPGYFLALINLAQLEVRQGDYGAADRHYAQLAASSRGTPRVFDPLVLRGQARIRALQGDRTQAEALWTEAEALLRQTTGASGQFVPGQSAPGESVSGESAPSQPADRAAFGHQRDLARLLLERGHPEDRREAVALMATEVKVRRDAETLGTYAWALFQAGDLSQAQQKFTAAIALKSSDASLYDRAAALEQALGNATQAQTYRQKALQIDPQFGEGARNALNLAAGLGG